MAVTGIFSTISSISLSDILERPHVKRANIKYKIDGVNSQLNEVPSDSERAAIMLRQKDGLKSTLELHQRKGEVFYDRKKAAGMEAQRWDEIEAVCFDYQKNLPCPNITTQDVYYSRQLSFHSFNIHVLSSDKVFFFNCYDETVCKKGQTTFVQCCLTVSAGSFHMT